jgi:Na+-transporting methylmalonyl-CoA/oxaloacetate decarboxylase gamma subunit
MVTARMVVMVVVIRVMGQVVKTEVPKSVVHPPNGLPTGRKRSFGRQAHNLADSQEPDLADMVLALWTHNARKGPRQADAKKVDRTQEKVRAWLDSAE